jgi:iron complex outermembrane receptor protein
MYTDEAGNTRFYDNETDNYQQDHSQLHWNERWSDNWSSNFALHYTKGKGYYENYKEDAKFSSYGLTPIVINGTNINRTDLVRQKWLDNDFYGTTFSANYTSDALQLILGGGYNKYEGLHFGKVIWARYASQSELGDRYYEDFATKTDGNFFAKVNYQVSEQLSLYGDLQYRHVQYKADSPETGLVNDTFRFFNPKAGLNFKFDELGWRLNNEKIQLNTNIYYMAYKNQLILTGKLDDVGAPIRSNSEKSYRLGLEVDATIALSEQWMVRPNFTLSANKNVDLNITDTNFGTTDIAYSPSVIVGNVLVFSPIKALHLSLLQKFVGEQFMNNIELPAAKLADYFVNDFNVSYTFKPKTIFKEIVLSGLVNNILDKKYVSNGYMYDIYPSYYPQAGINFLAGLNLKF